MVKLVSTRYYYTDAKRFEQSVDVYQPILSSNNNNQTDAEPSGVIVVLTVGSAWMGHCWWIYRACAWWNSSGPRTIATALQAPTVCVRHRGAFFQLGTGGGDDDDDDDDSSVMGFYCHRLLLPAAAVAAVASAAAAAAASTLSEQHHSGIAALLVIMVLPFLLLLLVAGFLYFLKWCGRGSARLDDMVEDVATAMAWVQANKDKILLSNDNNNTKNNDETKIVFGGYSSGGHVAATLLSRPHVWKQHQLPPPERLCSAVLLISGVLAVQPVKMMRRATTIADEFCQRKNGSRPSSSSSENNLDDGTYDDLGVTTTTASNSSFSSDNDVQEEDNDVASKKMPVEKKQPPSSPPVWLSNLVMRAVWGRWWREEVPSPLAKLTTQNNNNNNIPRIPHLLIQNRHELPFGLPWLNAFFCAEAYSQQLQQQMQVPTIYRQVHSDHWRILASRDLHDTVREELPKLLRVSKDDGTNRLDGE